DPAAAACDRFGHACANRARGLVPYASRQRPPRDRLRERRTYDRRGRAARAHRLHRGRTVRQRHGQGVGRDQREEVAQYPAAFRGGDISARMVAGGLARVRRSYLPRSMAETTALEATFYSG